MSISLIRKVRPPLRLRGIELHADIMEAIPQHGVHLDKLSPVAGNEVHIIGVEQHEERSGKMRISDPQSQSVPTLKKREEERYHECIEAYGADRISLHQTLTEAEGRAKRTLELNDILSRT
eukprot:3290688-Amphidinium_carterae.1